MLQLTSIPDHGVIIGDDGVIPDYFIIVIIGDHPIIPDYFIIVIIGDHPIIVIVDDLVENMIMIECIGCT